MPMTRRVRPACLAALPLLALLSFCPSQAFATDPVWSRLPDEQPGSDGPVARHGHTAVLDPSSHRMIVFGGWSSGGAVPLGDVQTLSLDPDAAWNSPALAPGPAPRFGHSALWDPVRGRMLVFGGSAGGSTAFGDVWSLALGGAPGWTELTPSGPGPSPRLGQSAIYDPVRDRVIVFGGYDPVAGFLHDVWELALSGTPAWTELSPVGPAPPVRDYHAAIYDPPGDRMIVFGGNNGATTLGDAWSLSLGASPAWTPLAIEGPAPASRLTPAYAFDAAVGRLILFGGWNSDSGSLGDAWSLSLGDTPAWSPLAPSGDALSPRYSASMVYDDAAHRVLVHGGFAALGSSADLRQIKLGPPAAWAPFLPPPALPALFGQSMTLDPARSRLVLYGGAGAVAPDSPTLWTLALSPPGTGWVAANAPGGPPRRYGHSAMLDPVRDRLIVFGGFDGAYLGDLWELPLPTMTWQLLPASGPPPSPRDYHEAIYDPVRDRMLVFGGNFAGTTLDELWELSLSGTPAWTQLAPSGPTPPSRLAHRMVYDPGHDRVLVFGGWNDATGYLGDTWQLSLSPVLEWVQLSPGGPLPSPRFSHTLVLDPSHSRGLMFGGEGGHSLNDLWALSLSADPSWSLLATSGGPPAARHGHAAAFDLARDQMVVEGGAMVGDGYLSDTWFLALDVQPTAIAASVVAAQVAPGHVTLTWYAADPPEGPCAVLRREGSGAWLELARVAFDGTGRLVFEDPAARAGRRYVYALREAGAAEPSAFYEVEVPRGATLALAGPTQSPATGSMRIRFSLPDAAPARLEVMDVAGRAVFRSEVGSLGVGSHVVDAGRVEPGIYWIRLTRGPQVLTARGAVVR